ncbi:MFS transporter [Rhodoferax sp. GW822-FHT02A01]|uniref:MFS transporter n=1 Tax=Rhodoferax sp. GW822-FHT02A01 TaxID=3141537 RepID=UPI00315D63E4
MVAHCAGMVDLVALPIWVGTLISQYRLDPQQAGLLATLFLAGVVLASLLLAPRFHRFNGRLVATLGFGVSALCFAGASVLSDFGALAVLHALAGLSSGFALSVTHGTISRSTRPHRLFALVGMALGVFAIVFVGATPPSVAALGGPVLFRIFAGVMAVGALVAATSFPLPDALSSDHGADVAVRGIPRAVWFGILGIACMALVQAMTFSFLERVGRDRGFGLEAVTGVLIALGFVNLFPAGLAALLERRWRARNVMLVGPALQVLLVVTIMNATTFVPYALAASVFAAVMIFTHTFAFGLLSGMDPSGRSMAATPAMMMTGAAIGPILGGTLVKLLGYGSLGGAALVIGVCAIFAFSRIPATQPSLPPQGVTP